jgi:toxin ParE1/3/4
MLKIQISEEAGLDIEDISFYTYEKWGSRQADKYGKELYQCFEKLAKNPLIGRDVSNLIPNARLFLFEAHAIFYKVSDTEIYVFRILGQKQDFGRHL